MNGGRGSGVPRSEYLAALGLDPSEGAKGTDLRLPGTPGISLAEAQLERQAKDARDGRFARVIFQDGASTETRDDLERIWTKPSIADPSRTWGELARTEPSLGHWPAVVQAHLPTVAPADEGGGLLDSPRAGGGHGIFLYNAIRMALHPELRPRVRRGQKLIGAISNGEDFSSAPDELIAGRVAEGLPIALVMTEKTAVDRQTGLLALLRDRDGSLAPGLIETAQAKEAGWLPEFEAMGGQASTNLFVIHYRLLGMRLRKLARRLGGEERMLREIMPEPIVAWKTQTLPDGSTRRYGQREIPAGALFFNLQRVWSREFPRARPIAYLINVDRAHRTELHAPIKSAAHFFMYFHSDRFTLDRERMRLVDHRPGELPLFDLDDRHYKDTLALLRAFDGMSILGLDALRIRGPASLRGARLRGRVEIVNETAEPLRLDGEDLADVAITARADGRIERRPL